MTHRFDVLVRTWTGEVVVLPSVGLRLAKNRARLEAQRQRRNVYVRNVLTGVTRTVRPDKTVVASDKTARSDGT